MKWINFQKLHEGIKPWLDVIAVLIAAFALIFTGWSGYQTIRHNELSMRPYIEVSPQFGGIPEENGIYLDVTGPGTAIVKEFKILIDDKEVDLSSGKKSRKLFHNLLNLKGIVFYTGIITPETALPPGYRFPIIRLEKSHDQLTIDQQNEIYNSLGRVRVYIKYESLYGEIFESDVNFKNW